MTRDEYLEALAALDVPPSGKVLAEMLGLSNTQCHRMATGASPIGKQTERLLFLLNKVQALERRDRWENGRIGALERRIDSLERRFPIR